MAGYQSFDIAFSKKLGAMAIVILIAGSGCSLLSSKEEVPGHAPSTRVSANANEVALPVEINNDIGKIIGGAGGGQFSSGGRVNVNVNVNFNGRGWTKTVTETNGAGQVISTSETPVDTVQGKKVDSERAPANQESATEAVESEGSEAVPVSPSSSGGVGKTKKYLVKPGDTLMKIAFQSYGNVYRWREILNANKGKIANYSALTPGTELTINGVGYVVIERNGKPYLIVRHDTLGKISHKVYGTNSFWRELWKNNPQLIHNPHRIYAGFTLYYRDRSELGVPVRAAKSSGGQLPAKRIPANKTKK